MGVDKNFSMFIKLKNKEKDVDRFITIYEKHCGEMQLIDRMKEDAMHELDFGTETSDALKKSIREKNSDEVLYWDVGSGGYISIQENTKNETILAIDATGRDRFTYTDLFGQYMNIAKEMGNSCYQMYSEADNASKFIEAAYDRPYHKISNRKGIDKFLKNMGIARGEGVQQEVPVEELPHAIEYSHYSFARDEGVAELLYNVKLDAVEKEPAVVRNVIHLTFFGQKFTPLQFFGKCRGSFFIS